jgi:protein ImuA
MVAESQINFKKDEIIAALQTDILRLQGFKSFNNAGVDLGLGLLKDAFPNATFPLGAVHEFLSADMEAAAATSGFVSGLLSSLMGNNGTALWIGSSRTLFPPALRNFGIQPDRFIFIDLQKERDVMWAMDEALKCGALTAVVGEMQDISFTASRRLQLAVEQSHVTGFILRNDLSPTKKINTTACVSRWRITPLPSDPIDNLPGIGFPKWKVELLRIRNGKPGIWDIQWNNRTFDIRNHQASIQQPESSIKNPEFSIKDPASRIQHPESSIKKQA